MSDLQLQPLQFKYSPSLTTRRSWKSIFIIMVAEPFVAAHTAHASDSVAHHIIHIFGKPIGKKYQQRQLVLEHSGSLATH